MKNSYQRGLDLFINKWDIAIDLLVEYVIEYGHIIDYSKGNEHAIEAALGNSSMAIKMLLFRMFLLNQTNLTAVVSDHRKVPTKKKLALSFVSNGNNYYPVFQLEERRYTKGVKEWRPVYEFMLNDIKAEDYYTADVSILILESYVKGEYE